MIIKIYSLSSFFLRQRISFRVRTYSKTKPSLTITLWALLTSRKTLVSSDSERLHMIPQGSTLPINKSKQKRSLKILLMLRLELQIVKISSAKLSTSTKLFWTSLKLRMSKSHRRERAVSSQTKLTSPSWISTSNIMSLGIKRICTTISMKKEI